MTVCRKCAGVFEWQRRGPHFYCVGCKPTGAEKQAAWRARPGNREKEHARQHAIRIRPDGLDERRSASALKARRARAAAVERGEVFRSMVSKDHYRRLFDHQGGRCASCGEAERSLANNGIHVRRLSVDHDHVTGHVRGLLCSACNTALGLLRDDPALIEALLAYVGGHLVTDRLSTFVASTREVRNG